jgi:hypothetical protein
MRTIIKPALTPPEWNQRRSGPVSVYVVDDENHVAVRDPDGELVSVSGDDELFTLIALANNAMSDDDARKLCRKDLAVLSVLTEEYRRQSNFDGQILAIASTLYDKVAALLPGAGIGPTPPTGTDVSGIER